MQSNSATGRGAWTDIGGTTPYYEIANPRVGELTQPDIDFISYRAVRMGVKAIQDQLGQPMTGVWGTATTTAAKTYQEANGLVVDGVFGPASCTKMFSDLLKTTVTEHDSIILGIIRQESNFDPGAVGYETPDDKGLFQFNLPASQLTAQTAFNPRKAINDAENRFRGAWVKYSGKGALIQEQCAVASWNSPLWADEWFGTGQAPNAQIATYVTNVINYATEF